MNDDQLVDVLDRLRNRFFGKYRGTVTDVDATTLRIKAKVPSVLGTQPTGWCMACVPYAGDSVGMAFFPATGAGVWIEFEGGDVSYPIWTGCYWRTDDRPSGAKEDVRAIITAKHSILLDDAHGTITISDSNGNTIVLNDDGITLKHGDHHLLIADGSVSVDDGVFQVTY